MLWLKGKIHPNTDTLLTANDRGVSLGDGLFETLSAFNGKAFLKAQHIARMKASADDFGLPFDPSTIERAINDLAEIDQEPGIIRVTLTRGIGERGLAFPKDPKPEIFATRSPWTNALAFQKISLGTTKIRRNPTSPLSSHKTLSYLDNVMALNEAQQKEADDALMLDQDGHVASTSMANLFAISGRELQTPSLSSILPGITRNLILEIAPTHGLTINEKNLHPRDLFAADLVFSTNSVRFMTRITMIDGNHLHSSDNTHYINLQSALKERLFAETGYRM